MFLYAEADEHVPGPKVSYVVWQRGDQQCHGDSDELRRQGEDAL